MSVVNFEGSIYISGGIKSTNSPDFERYEPADYWWTKMPDMRVQRKRMGVAILGRYLYVVGGESFSPRTIRDENIQSVERFSFDRKVWEMIPDMMVPRCGPVVAAVDGYLYVAGGDGQISFERFDPNTNNWERLPDMPEARYTAVGIAL